MNESKSALKLLDIGGNNIGPNGILAVMSALRGNETLKTLELGYNPLGPDGAKHLADVVKYDLKVGRWCQGWCITGGLQHGVG